MKTAVEVWHPWAFCDTFRALHTGLSGYFCRCQSSSSALSSDVQLDPPQKRFISAAKTNHTCLVLYSANTQAGGQCCKKLCPFFCYNKSPKCYGVLLVLQLYPPNWTKRAWKSREKNPSFVMRKGLPPSYRACLLLSHYSSTSFQQCKHLPAQKIHELLCCA